MSSWKCGNCGLVNFAMIEVCRRCQFPARNGSNSNPYPSANFQANSLPPQGNFQANNTAQQENFPTGNLPAQYPQASNNYPTQSGGYSPNQSYQQNDYTQGIGYPQGGDSIPNSGYANNHPYSQNSSYGSGSGYAYNRGDTNGFDNLSHPYTNYTQTDYSQAPSYGAPSVGTYQASYTSGYGGQGAGVWREGDKLVMHKQARLPDRCVKCNAPTDHEYVHRKLSWLHPAWLLLILASWIIYLIVYLVIRKKAEVDFGLCEQHRANRRTGISVGWVTVLLGIGCFILAIAGEMPALILLGICLFLFGLIFASYAANVVSVTKMDDHYIWMKRVNKDYLANFPPTGGY